MKKGLDFLGTLVKTTGAIIGVIVVAIVVLVVGTLAVIC